MYPDMSQTDFVSLPVHAIIKETEDTVTVQFAVPPTEQERFTYQAGQYLTLRFVIDGQDVRRAYSMSSSPLDDTLAVSVKRVRNGLVSNHIADHLKAGSMVEVMPPQGRFIAQPQPGKRRNIYLFGAGSGITPLMSIIRTLLEQEPKSKLFLLYGNRDENSIIFQEQLQSLQEKYQGQLFVEHTLSQPLRHKTGGLSRFFTKGKVAWNGNQGRIDDAKVQAFLADHPQDAEETQYYVCGPGTMIDSVEQSLLSSGIDKALIHTERFVSAHDTKKKTAAVAVDTATVTARLNGKEVVVQLKAGQTILDGLLEAKVDPPYSCLAGACSTCAAKVLQGGVKMDVCYALDEDEVAEGMILTCQSRPSTAEVKIDFQI